MRLLRLTATALAAVLLVACSSSNDVSAAPSPVVTSPVTSPQAPTTPPVASSEGAASATTPTSPSAASGSTISSVVTTIPTTVLEPPYGWQSDIESLKPNSPGVIAGSKVTLTVMGDCNSRNRQGMLLKATGFPSNGDYASAVTRPDGSLVSKDYNFRGKFDKNGQPSRWKFSCIGSYEPGGKFAVGQYTLHFWDVTPGSPTANREYALPFKVSYP